MDEVDDEPDQQVQQEHRQHHKVQEMLDELFQLLQVVGEVHQQLEQTVQLHQVEQVVQDEMVPLIQSQEVQLHTQVAEVDDTHNDDYDELVEVVMEKAIDLEMVVQVQQILVEVDEAYPEQHQQLDITEDQVL